MPHFTVQATEPLTLAAAPPLSEMYTLSPFVWLNGPQWEILVRAVPRRDDVPALKISSAFYGVSQNGLHFQMESAPVIAAGPDAEDLDGCEDPTVAIWNGTYYVYYTGWSQDKMEGNLMLATGPDPRRLAKRGVYLASSPAVQNPKEATIVSVPDGTWRLFFEYAEDGASKIGIASAPAVDGPWTVGEPLFESRPDAWDNWHLSTGPMLQSDPNCPVMFYNGATQNAHWRIGWIAFDADYTRVIDRCGDPLIVPPTPKGSDTDIAFAASSVETQDALYLYYSVADQYLMRATLKSLQ